MARVTPPNDGAPVETTPKQTPAQAPVPAATSLPPEVTKPARRPSRKPASGVDPAKAVSDAVDSISQEPDPFTEPRQEVYVPAEASAPVDPPKADEPPTPAKTTPDNAAAAAATKQSPRLLALASHFGIDSAGLSNAELKEEIEAAELEEQVIERRQARQRLEAEAAARKPAAPVEDDFSEVEIEEDGVKVKKKVDEEVSPVVRALLKKQSEQLKQLREAQAEQTQRGEQEKAAAAWKNQLDKAFTTFGEEWKPILGTGGVDALVAANNSAAIHVRNTIISAAQAAIGAGSRRTLEQEIERAAQSIFGQFVKPAEETPAPAETKNPALLAEQQRWNRGTIAIPTDQKPGKRSALDQTLATIAARNGDGATSDTAEDWKKDQGFPD